MRACGLGARHKLNTQECAKGYDTKAWERSGFRRSLYYEECKLRKGPSGREKSEILRVKLQQKLT